MSSGIIGTLVHAVFRFAVGNESFGETPAVDKLG